MPVIDARYNDKEVQALLRELNKKFSNLRPLFSAIGEIGLFHIDKTFQDETDQFGVPWPENSASWNAYKRANGRILKINQSTGLMRSRTTYQATSTSLTIINNDRKASKRNQKAPFIQFGPAFRQDTVDLMKEHLRSTR